MTAPGFSDILPPDPEGRNDMRALSAAVALQAFQDQSGCDEQDILVDLLTNLLHWCDRNGKIFGNVLSMAQLHYEAETTDG